MKIIIVKSNTKAGDLFDAYRPGVLSFLGIYCSLNKMLWTGSGSKQGCIERAKKKLIPDPKPNKKVVCEVEI